MILNNINTDIDHEVGPGSTAQQYFQHLVFTIVESWVRIYGGTRDEAIAAALDNAIPDAGGRTGMRARIRTEASRRKAEGTFIAAGETKWLPASAVRFLAAARHLTNTEIAPMTTDAADGTRYNLTGAKVTAALKAWAEKQIAIDTARDAALADYQANPNTFNFDAIAWPAEYVPA